MLLEILWEFCGTTMRIYGNLWEFMGIYGNLYGNLWEFMGICGNGCGKLWEIVGILNKVRDLIKKLDCMTYFLVFGCRKGPKPRQSVKLS